MDRVFSSCLFCNDFSPIPQTMSFKHFELSIYQINLILCIVGKLNWSAYFADEDQRGKVRLTKKCKDLALLISKLQLGQDEMSFKDYMIMKGEDIIEVEFCMSKLVDVALEQRIKTHSFDFNAELLDSLNVDERPPPIVKLTNAQHHAQLLARVPMDNPSESTPTYAMKLHAISKKLNEIYMLLI